MMYSFRNRCEEIPELEYEDGLRFLYFYTKGTKGGSESIHNMLKYMQDSKQESAVDDATRELDRYVSDVRRDPEIRGNYMTFGDRIDWEKEMSREEGREEGLKEGLKEGRQEGVSLLADAIARIRKGSTVEDLVKDGVDEKIAEIAWTCK